MSSTIQTLFLRRLPGGAWTAEDAQLTTGSRFFVSSGTGADVAGRGLSPDAPFASLDYAIGSCVANNGDRIYLLPGHSEALTTSIALDVAGVTIVGLGEGLDRPEFTANGAIDLINVTATDCALENLFFQEATAAATANINVAAARLTLRSCVFELGANDLDNITIPAGGTLCTIEDCIFRITADGPDSAVTIEGGCDNLSVKRCYFDGMSTTNTWDDAAFDFGSTTPVNVRIEDNTFSYTKAVLSTGATPRVQGGNRYLRGARACAGASIDIFASASVTGTKSGTAEDPTTLKDAVDLATAGDRVRIYPGQHTVTAALALDVANVTLEPVDYRHGSRGSSVEILNSTDDIRSILVTAAGCAVRGIRFTKGINNTSDGTALIGVTAGGDYLSIVDCVFDMVAHTNADAINLATGTRGHLIDNCFFTDGASAKSYIVWACSTLEVKNCMFDNSATQVVVSEQIASPGDGSFIHDNLIVSNGSAGGGAGTMASWQSSPGKNVFTKNYVFGSSGDTDGCGDDTDLDAYAYGNLRDGATDGTTTTLNPSIS